MPIALLTTSLVTQIIIFGLAFIVLKYKYGKATLFYKKSTRVMSWYFVFAGIVDIAGFVFAMEGMPCTIVYRIFNIVEFVLLAYMFFVIENELTFKILVLVVSVIVGATIIGGNLREINNELYPAYYMAIAYLTLAIFSMRGFYWTTVSKVTPIKEPQLWASIGFIFYFSINTIAMLLWTPEHIITGTYISISANIIKNLIMFWSYVCLMKQSKLL